MLRAEFFNSSCYACALMAPVMDEVFRRVAADEALRDRVRFLGIGAGNTYDQVRCFRDIAFLKKRVVGRYLTQEIVFDPAVDAVSTRR